MTPDAKNCLEALNDMTAPNGEMCMPFKPVMDATGLDRKTVRRNIRALARKGLAEYFRGLWTEDGEMAGAGYCISCAGREMVDDAVAAAHSAGSMRDAALGRT